jgi:DNA-binding NarL/FixJ family response regulator
MTLNAGAAHNLTVRKEREAPLCLVLIEDRTVLRDGLKALLQLHSDVLIVGEYSCAESASNGIHQLQPDVVVADLALRNGSGIELIGAIQHLSPCSRKLVLTGSDCPEHIRAALCAGADGYVLKDASSAELMLAIRTVSIGQRFLCKAIASKILSGFLVGDKKPPSSTFESPITVREREVLIRIAQGCSNKMMACELGLSPKTVATHRVNLMRKLQLRNIAAVTLYAIKNGLVGSNAPGISCQSPDIGFAALRADAPIRSRSGSFGR